MGDHFDCDQTLACMFLARSRTFHRVALMPSTTRPFHHSQPLLCNFNMDEWKEKATRLQSELAELKERCERVAAEKEVLNRNVKKDLTDARHYGITSFAKQLLNVNDNLALALENTDLDAENSKEQLQILLEGIQMVYTEAENVFQKEGITAFTPQEGDVYNAIDHLIVKTLEPQGDNPKDLVANVRRKGYKLRDRVIRQAEVEIRPRHVEKKQTPPPPTPKEEEKPVESQPHSSSSSDSESSEKEEKKD